MASEKKFAEKKSENLLFDLKAASEGLFYISESDAPFEPFVWKNDEKFTEVKAETVLMYAKQKNNIKVTEKTVDEFFKQPTEIQDWFGDEEKEQAAKFNNLKDLLETRLNNTKVFKFGEVQIDIFIVGIDSDGNLAGVKTSAVET